MIYHAYTCPRACPGFLFPEKPLGQMYCPNCREVMRHHTPDLPGPSLEPLPKAGVR